MDMAASACRCKPNRRGGDGQSKPAFTLIETALAIVVVSTGVLAIMAAQQAFHLKNAWSTHASTATWLASEIRELTLNLPRHDVGNSADHVGSPISTGA